MLRFLVGLFALVLSAQVIVVRHRGAPEGEPWLEGYAYRKELTIPAGAVTGDLTNFPVYVSLAGDADLAAHAQPDGSDIVFTDADGVAVLDFVVPRRTLGMAAASGAWNWINAPRAIKAGGKIFIAAQSYNGYPSVVGYDLATGVTSYSGPLFAAGQMGPNDHDGPSLLELSDGRIVAFYEYHGGPAFYRISSNAYDITSWGSQFEITNVFGPDADTFSYAQVFRLPSEGNKIFYFHSNGSDPSVRQPHMAIVTEVGLATNTWTSIVQWLNTGKHGPYPKFVSNGVDRIYVAFSDCHPKNGSTYIRAGYYYNGNWYALDGTLLGAATGTISADGFTLVYSGRSWPYDVALDADEHLVIAYVAFPTTEDDHRYRYAHCAGATCTDNEITPGGSTIADGGAEPYYSGGLELDHANPSVVYLSRNNTGTGNFVAEKWTTSDNGVSWTHETLVSEGKTFRPTFAHGAASDDPFAVTWMQGDYVHYTNYTTAIVAAPAHYPTRDVSWLQTAWVKMPSITVAGGAKVYMYYGRENPPALSNPASVWAAAEWHFPGHTHDFGYLSHELKSGTGYWNSRQPSVRESEGKLGRALLFPNSGQLYVGVFNLADRRTLSIMGWVKAANGYILSNRDGDNTKAEMFLRIHPTSRKLSLLMRNTADQVLGVFEPVVFDANTWHHIAVVLDADNGGWKAWIDGVQSPTVFASGPFPSKASAVLRIGFDTQAGQALNGSLDELRLYPGALTEAEIEADYAAGVGTLVQVGAEEVR